MIKFTLTLVLLLLITVAPQNAHSLRRDPCTDTSAICKERNGERVCGFPGESFRSCVPTEFSRKRSIDLRELRAEAVSKCKAQALYEYKQDHEGSPLQHLSLQALMRQCELTGWKNYTK